MMQAEIGTSPSVDTQCGIPRDAQYFDDSGVEGRPDVGRQVVLARFELEPQYCGVFEYFSQFTDLLARDPAEIATPGLQWMILTNGRPLYPYVQVERVINPWGYGSFPVSIRLDDNSRLEFVVRNVGYRPDTTGQAITRVGGRIVGRYWYNPAFGDGPRWRR